MGSAPVPNYANIFMDKRIDKKLKQLLEALKTENGENAQKLFKRFLDDIFLIFSGKTKDLHTFLKEANNINPTIQLTMSHTSVEGESTEDKCSSPDHD